MRIYGEDKNYIVLAINELEKRNLEIHELNQKNNSILGMKIQK